MCFLNLKNSLNNFIFHLSWLEKLSPAHTHPLISIHEFLKPYKLYFELESLIKCWMWIGKKIYSIILSVTCDGLRNFPLLIHIPSKPVMNFWNPMYEWLFSELESLIKCWMWIGKKIHSIILSVTCHGFRNFPLLMHIPSKPFVNFWNPSSYYFSELESLIKMLNVNFSTWPTHPTPTWHTPAHPYMTHPHPHPTPPFMAHPATLPHPGPLLHDPPTPPYPNPPPPPPLVYIWAQRSLFFIGCFTMAPSR